MNLLGVTLFDNDLKLAEPGLAVVNGKIINKQKE
jgi:hypothetical protein